jgi:RNA polymerase sigma-70 factor (ECF subfamily)
VRLQNNRKTDIATLYSEYGDALHRFLAKKLPCSDAADLLHDTFVRVLCLAEGYELHSPRPFLFRIANNLVLDYLKSGRNSGIEVTESGSDKESQPVDTITPEASAYSQQRLIVLQQAIDELPPRCRQVFLLHKFEHRSHADIAEMLGVSVNMVEKHVIRALAHCRKQLAALD